MPSPVAPEAAFRAALLAADAALALALLGLFRKATDDISGALDDLQRQAEEAARTGAWTAGWLYAGERLPRLLAGVQARLAAFAEAAGPVIADAAHARLRLAEAHARFYLTEGRGPAPPGTILTFNRLHPVAFQKMAVSLAPGAPSFSSPLRGLLDTLPGEGSARVHAALLQNNALGNGPGEVAQQIAPLLGGTLSHALTLARTTTMTAYREASLEIYRANADVAQAWCWTCDPGPHTCILCLMMDGTVHPLDEEFASHPRCRCSPRPVTATGAELGFDVPDVVVKPAQTGGEWFLSQSEDVQKSILGPAKYAAWKAGDITLQSLVGEADDPQWGRVRFENSLAAAKGKRWGANISTEPPPKQQPQ